MNLEDFNGAVEQASYKALRDLLERHQAIRESFANDDLRDLRIWNRLEGQIVRCLDRVVYGVQPTYTYMWDPKDGDERNPYTLRRLRVSYHLRHDNSIAESRDEPAEFVSSTETAYRRPYFYQFSRAIEDNPNQYNQEFLDDRVIHIEFFISGPRAPQYAPSTPEDRAKLLKRLKKTMRPKGYQFIGCKAKGNKPIAVFVKGNTFREALTNIAGRRIAKEIIDQDDMKKVQNLVIMLCRVGWKARVKEPMILRKFDTHLPDERLDGIIAGLDESNSKILREWFKLSDETRIIAGSYLGEDFMDKGLILLDQKKNFFADSPKLGKWGTTFDLQRFMIHEIDNLALSKTRSERIHLKDENMTEHKRNTHQGPAYYIGCNLKQQWIYCFTAGEQEVLINKVFLPEITRAGRLGGKFHELANLDRLISMGVTAGSISEREIRNRLKTWVLQAALNAPIEGMYVIATPDPNLKPFEIRVPRKAQRNGYQIGDIIDGGRQPMLAVGNGIQRFKIVGYTTGNFCQVGPHPWMTIMGGDFDGDLIFITKCFVELFPDKKWDQTPMTDINPETSIRPGVKSESARIDHAVIVMSQMIGLYDFAARQAWEIGRLTRQARLTLSRATQAEIHTAKHNAVREIGPKDLVAFRPRKISGTPVEYATGIVRNAVKESKQKLLNVTKGLPFHRLFVRAYEVIEQELPTKRLDTDLIKGKADTIPDDDTFNRKDWEDLRRYGRSRAIESNERFNEIFLNRESEINYQILADHLTIWLERQAMKVAERGMKDWLATAMMSGNKYKPPSLEKRYKAARNYLLLQLGGIANWRLICRLGVPGWEDIVRAATPADPVTIDPETRLILSQATQAEIDNAGH